MRCAQCNSPFRLAIWIIQCGECKEQYCTKCMRRANGIYYCHKCTVLIMKPPDINELMKLKAKDLQEYLSRHNIPTFGYVEKRELVDLLCNKNIPVKNTKTSTVLNKILSNIESVFLNERGGGNGSRATSPTSPTSQTPPPRPPRPPPPGIFSSTSTGNLNVDSNGRPWTFQTAPPTQSTTTSVDETTTTTSPGAAQSPLRPTAPPPPPEDGPPQNSNPEPTTSSSSAGDGADGTGSNGGGSGGGTLNYGFRPEFSATSTSTPESSPAPSPLPRRIPKLSDYEAVDDLNGISTKELKMLLTYNRVDYKGCVEKSELLEKAKILWKDHRQKRAELPQNLEDLCKLCMDAPLDCVLLECGHIATCINCGKQLAECPICRQYVTRIVRTFKA